MIVPSRAQSSRAVLAGVVCLAILAGTLVGHAWPLWTGRTVVLPVRLVDPRDPFRGEYVRLDTPLTRVQIGSAGPRAATAELVRPVGDWWSELPADPQERQNTLSGRLLYLQLEPRTAPDGTVEHRAVSISDEPVAGALNLRGRVQFGGSDGEVLRLDYGLDAFFMQEGAPRAVEDAIRSGPRVRMEVAVASSGRARIRNLIVDGRPLPR